MVSWNSAAASPGCSAMSRTTAYACSSSLAESTPHPALNSAEPLIAAMDDPARLEEIQFLGMKGLIWHHCVGAA